MDFPHEIKYIKLSELRPHPKNPRVHPDKLIAKLARSIGEFGLYNFDPMADGVIIGHYEGHKRGIASNHADPGHWFPKHGKSMDTFCSGKELRRVHGGRAGDVLQGADYRQGIPEN